MKHVLPQKRLRGRLPISFGTANAVACQNIRFSSLFAAGDVSGETSQAAKNEEKRMFSQATSAKAWLF